MSVQRLSDNRALRAMTVQQADALFQEIALLTVKIEKTKAQYEKRIAELKAAAGRETEAPEAELREKAALLKDYMKEHEERFIQPRQHKTEYGCYGFRNVSKLEITDEEAIIKYARDNGHDDLILLKVKLDERALKKAIGDGLLIPGCEMRRGEVASYTVAKALMEE